MLQSEQTDKIVAALVAAGPDIGMAKFNAENEFFKKAGKNTKYANLVSVLEAVKPPMAKHGIAITQTTEGRTAGFVLVTTLRHISGQWIASEYPLPQVAKPQELASALTYARRYSLSAIACISADEDDDGNAAQQSNQVAEMPKQNAHVTRVEDVTERRYRVDAGGHRYDWIDTDGHRVQKLTGEKAKALYKTLRTAMLMCDSEDDLVEWGKEHAEQVAMLGKSEDFFQLVEYQTHLDGLRSNKKAAA